MNLPTPLSAQEWWAVLAAVLCCTACAVLGCFLVLRRMSLLGDAISHAVLPGIVGAFLLTGSRATLPVLVGAMIVGVLTAWLTSVLHRWGRVPEDASMGVVFTSLFAIGVLMINLIPGVDLDANCVLYGELEYTGLDRVALGGLLIPRAVLMTGAMLLLDTALVLLLFKELKIVSFDPGLAAASGISVAFVHYGLMSLVAATAVASFESVGAILVIAMLIAPGAAAHLLTDRLAPMVLTAAALGAASAVMGVILAVQFDTTMAGMTAVTVGAFFALAVLLSPRHGVLAKGWRQFALGVRIVAEDVLGELFRWNETHPRGAMPPARLAERVGRGWRSRLALSSLQRDGDVARDAQGAWMLTDCGLRRAGSIIRSHRLWETYLSEQLGSAADHLHEPATRMEHFVDEALRRRLESQIQAETDPHGKTIPLVDAE